MTTRIYLIRHAVTQLAAEDRFSGMHNVPLSEAGRHQAGHLAQRLAAFNPAAIYCSPLERTVETASIVAGPHSLIPILRDGLREIDHGHWEGLNRSEVNQKFPGEFEAWDADPFGYAPEGGETGAAVLARALPVMREIVSAHPDQSVFIVSHKATNRLIIGHYLGIELRGYRDRLDQQPACLNILDFRDAVRARLMLLNDVSHYESMPDQQHVHLSGWWAKKE